MRKNAIDSIAGKVEAAINAHRDYLVPEGLEDLLKSERIAWKQYTSSKSGWEESELRSLHALVKHETQLAKMGKEAAKTDFTYEKPGGGNAAEPIHGEYRNAQKMRHEMLRLLGLVFAGRDTTKVANAPTGSTRGKKATVSRLK